MFITFITTLKVLTRDKSVLLWAVAFPLVLSTLFYAMFSNLDELYILDPIPVIVVQDENFEEAEAFTALIDTLSETGNEDDKPLLNPHFVKSEAVALETLQAGEYKGYIVVDSKGIPNYRMDLRQSDTLTHPEQTVLLSVLDRFVQANELVPTLIEKNPALLMDQSFMESLTEGEEVVFTERISVTENPTSDSLRYFYSVLAFSTIMMSTFALVAVDNILGNTSPLGARRSLGGQSKIRLLLPTLSAAWLLSFACVMVGFVYQRFVFGIDFGGKEGAVVLTLAVSALSATFLGAFLGALPLPSATKSGFVAFFSCLLSLFAGLYGPFSQDLGDMVARDFPLLSAANPIRQVADAFFSLYYYDGYEALSQYLLSLLIFSLIFFVLSTLLIRRQRYASL